ncbi:MAG: hypothetical protein Q7R40_04640 [Phaeospirillum sp.]|nr:hypothetical protein [Phaeospirillum sp.]
MRSAAGIDRTIPNTNAFDRSEIANALKRATDLLKPGEHLYISTIRADATERRVVFNDCLPGKDPGLMGTPVDRNRVADDVWDRSDKNAPRGGAPYRPLLDLGVREGLESFWIEYFRHAGASPLRINR